MLDRRWILGGILLAGGIGLVTAIRRRPRLTEHSRLLMFGDSMAQGLDPHMKALSKEAGIPYFVAAAPGTRIDQWASSHKLVGYLTDFQPTITLVVLGTNDAYMSGNVWEKQAPHMEALVKKLREFSNVNVNDAPGSHYSAGTEIVWIGPPALPNPHGGRAPNAEFLSSLAEHAPHYFDSAAYEIPRGPDGLHPSAAGFAGWAGQIWSYLS